MDNSRTYTTTVRLNAEEARNELARLEAKVEELKRKKEQAFSVGDAKDGEKYAKQLRQAERDLNTFKLQTMDVQEVINNLGEASTSQINKAVKSLRTQMASLPTDSEEYKRLADMMQRCKDRLAEIGQEAKKSRQDVKQLQDNLSNLVSVMGDMKGASMEQLKQAESYLQGQVSSNRPDSTTYDVALSQLKEVRQRIAELNEEQKETVTIIDQYNSELEAAGLQMRQVSDGAELVRRTMADLDEASIRDIEYTMRLLNEQMKDVGTGKDNFKDLNQQLAHCRQRMAAIAREQRRNTTLVEQYDEEIRNATRDIKTQQREEELVNKTLSNLSTASMRDLDYALKMVNQQLREMNRGDNSFKEAEENARRLKAELERIKKEMEAHQSLIGRLITGLNRNWGAITQIIGAITGLSATVRGAVNDYASMEEEMANVRKYTGLTAEQVRELNEELKGMDTRTSREQLNQLAGAAGRLGLQSKEDILDFVEAADMIGVALGDDLGEGAVDQIGKLAMAFGEDERMGLRKAMLATGSALNELAQNSSAQAGFLVDFTARVAGFGKQLGLTQAQIMGFGTVMDENLLKDEMAATAFGNMLTKMQTDTEKFADIAGMSVREFADLVNNDANEAILRLADSLKRAEPQRMMEMLDSMGLDGSRAVAVLATMADKIDDVRRHQERATEAYAEATSVVSEFGTMNETVQAKIDKCKKAFKEMTVELGEKLLPVVRFTISTAGLMAKALSTVIKFVLQNATALVALASATTAYIVTAKLQAHWTAITSSAVFKALTSITGFREAMKKAAEGIMAFVGRLSAVRVAMAGLFGIVGGLIAKFVLFRDTATESAKTMEGITEAERVFEETLKGTRRAIEQDAGALKRLVQAGQDTKESVQQLAEKYPELVTQQMTAVEAYDALIKGSKAYCEQMAYEKKALSIEETIKDNEQELAVYEKMLEKLEEEAAITITPITGNMREWVQLQAEMRENELTADDFVPKDAAERYVMLTARVNQLKRSNELLEEELDATGEAMKDAGKDADESGRHFWMLRKETDQLAESTENLTRKGRSLGETFRNVVKVIADFAKEKLTTPEGPKTDPYQTDLKKLEENQKQAQYILKLQLHRGIIDNEQYNEQLYRSDMEFLARRLELQKKYGRDTADTHIQVLDRMAKEATRQYEKRKAEEEERNREYNEWLTASRKQLDARMKDKAKAATEEMKQQLQEQVQAEEDAAEQKRQIQERLYDEVMATMSAASAMFQQMQQIEAAAVESRYDKQIEAAKKAGRSTKKLEEKKEKEIAAIKTKYADREFQMKVLTIIADTAVGISKLWSNPGYPWAIPLTALVAAQGAMQLATAKMAQEQAKKGYYEGGFTGGRQYHKEAGVVHEGEFVANHQAVQNPAILPFLNFLDQAQRNNTVGSLTAADVSRSMGARDGSSAPIITPIVNVQTDNEQLREAVEAHREATELLLLRLKEPIDAKVVLTGPDGLNEQQQLLDSMLKNK